MTFAGAQQNPDLEKKTSWFLTSLTKATTKELIYKMGVNEKSTLRWEFPSVNFIGPGNWFDALDSCFADCPDMVLNVKSVNSYVNSYGPLVIASYDKTSKKSKMSAKCIGLFKFDTRSNNLDGWKEMCDNYLTTKITAITTTAITNSDPDTELP